MDDNRKSDDSNEFVERGWSSSEYSVNDYQWHHDVDKKRSKPLVQWIPNFVNTAHKKTQCNESIEER
jgi:hypothetical protein